MTKWKDIYKNASLHLLAELEVIRDVLVKHNLITEEEFWSKKDRVMKDEAMAKLEQEWNETEHES